MLNLFGLIKVKIIFILFDKIIGFVFKLCGVIGVIKNNFNLGVIIGLLVDSE